MDYSYSKEQPEANKIVLRECVLKCGVANCGRFFRGNLRINAVPSKKFCYFTTLTVLLNVQLGTGRAVEAAFPFFAKPFTA
jgi:hypothetical protein